MQKVSTPAGAGSTGFFAGSDEAGPGGARPGLVRSRYGRAGVVAGTWRIPLKSSFGVAFASSGTG